MSRKEARHIAKNAWCFANSTLESALDALDDAYITSGKTEDLELCQCILTVLDGRDE